MYVLKQSSIFSIKKMIADQTRRKPQHPQKIVGFRPEDLFLEITARLPEVCEVLDDGGKLYSFDLGRGKRDKKVKNPCYKV